MRRVESGEHARTDNISVFLAAGSTGSTPVPIPNYPALRGLRVYAQSLMFATGANTLGLISSNGVDLRLGNL